MSMWVIMKTLTFGHDVKDVFISDDQYENEN